MANPKEKFVLVLNESQRMIHIGYQSRPALPADDVRPAQPPELSEDTYVPGIGRAPAERARHCAELAEMRGPDDARRYWGMEHEAQRIVARSVDLPALVWMRNEYGETRPAITAALDTRITELRARG
jgi:hypothetical protein